jgi:hypothetical protein
MMSFPSRAAMASLSHAGDGMAEVMLAVTRCRCRVMPTTLLPSHAGNGTSEMSWSWSDVTVESCWRQC